MTLGVETEITEAIKAGAGAGVSRIKPGAGAGGSRHDFASSGESACSDDLISQSAHRR